MKVCSTIAHRNSMEDMEVNSYFTHHTQDAWRVYSTLFLYHQFIRETNNLSLKFNILRESLFKTVLSHSSQSK